MCGGGVVVADFKYRNQVTGQKLRWNPLNSKRMGLYEMDRIILENCEW